MRTAGVILMILIMPFIMAFTQDGNISKKNIYAEVTDNLRIIQALDLLDGTSGEWAKKAILGNNLSKKPIKIMFKDLSKISPNYTNFDALGWKDSEGGLLIFLNQKHSSAPLEAIASILCHEAIHQDTQSSIEEETFGWGYEADVWIQMKKKKPELKTISTNEFPLVDRLNTLERMFRDANFTTKEIKNAVMTNPGYKGLPMISPGFDKK